ncbi:MAG: hypothetical protein RLZZ138_499 [Actinomycetota bacterium]
MLKRPIESVIRYPVFDGLGRILPDGVQLVLRSKNSWPLHSESSEVFPSTSWTCQLAGWDEVTSGLVAAKVMLLVDYDVDFAGLGVAFARLAKLVFDDLRSNLDSQWFEDNHGWTYENNPYDWLDFFADDEPGMGSLSYHWTTPNLLHVQVRQVGFDDSFGSEQIVGIWNLVETRDAWDQVNVGRLSFDSFAKRLIAQAKQHEVAVKHLDALTSFRSWSYTFDY